MLAARLETLIVRPLAACTGFRLMLQPDPVVSSEKLSLLLLRFGLPGSSSSQPSLGATPTGKGRGR